MAKVFENPFTVIVRSFIPSIAAKLTCLCGGYVKPS